MEYAVDISIRIQSILEDRSRCLEIDKCSKKANLGSELAIMGKVLTIDLN